VSRFRRHHPGGVTSAHSGDSKVQGVSPRSAPDQDPLQLAEIVLGLLATAGSAGGSAARVASFPARVVAGRRVDATERWLAATGRRVAVRGKDVLTDVAEDALSAPELRRLIDEAFASQLPEALVESAVEHRIPQRLAASDAIDRFLASPEFGQLIERVMASPAVREALMRQTTSFGNEIRMRQRDIAADIDDRIGWVLRRATPKSGYGGLVARSIALVLDLLLVAVLLALGGVAVGLVASLARVHGPAWMIGTIFGGLWVVLADVYLVAFWTMLGQTPGMRVFDLRVTTAGGRPPGLGRSIVRVIGLALAILPLFLGLAPIPFDRRRRGLQDFLAGTTVQYDLEEEGAYLDDMSISGADAEPTVVAS